MKKIVHISPALPPAINGLGDFCKILAANLEKENFAENVFLVRTPIGGEHVQSMRAFEPDTFYAVLREARPEVVILHYVGYAYQKFALPFYVVNGLRKLKKEFSCRIITFFHELYSTSRSMLKLPFYTAVFQKLIVKQLCDLSYAVFTNCTHYNNLLKSIAGRDNVNLIAECTGIFSNVPEDLYDPEVGKEANSLVVFGSCPRRKSVFSHQLLTWILDALNIKTIYDIGPGHVTWNHSSVSLRRLGALPSQELAAQFNRIQYGALCYEPELLGKSGIFSAYTAFGIIPVNLIETNTPLNDNLIEGKNYFNLGSLTDTDHFEVGRSREEILNWYKMRNQHVVTRKVKKHL